MLILGCGVFQNNATEMGHMFAQAISIPVFKSHFRRIVFAIPGGRKGSTPSINYHAFRTALLEKGIAFAEEEGQNVAKVQVKEEIGKRKKRRNKGDRDQH